MKVRAEYVAGLAAIGFLLWWIATHKQAVIQQAGPQISMPRGSIYTSPPAPDLSRFTLTGPNVPKYLQAPPPKTINSPAPCACGCDENGADNMVTQTVLDFTKSLTAAMGDTFNTYIKNIVDAIPPFDKQLLDNPDLASANAVLKAQASAFGAVNNTPLRVGSVQYNAYTEAYDAAQKRITGADVLARANNITMAQLNQYTPGRIVTLSADATGVPVR